MKGKCANNSTNQKKLYESEERFEAGMTSGADSERSTR
jgi:hypothetical protein